MRTIQLILFPALLLACGGDPEDTDTDTDTDTVTPPPVETGTPSETGETGTPGETGDTGTPPVVRDGTWTGTVTLEVTDKGIVENVDTCTAPITLTIDTTVSPNVTGSAVCSNFSGPLAGQSSSVSFQGDLADPDVIGSHDFSYLWVNSTSSWSGLFFSETTFTAGIQGSSYSGPNGVEWTGSVSVEKQ